MGIRHHGRKLGALGLAVALTATAGPLNLAGVSAQDATPSAGSVCAALLATPAPAGEMGAAPTLSEQGGTPVFANVMRGFDLLYIDMMIPYHEGSVAMSRVALERAEHPELREQAQETIDHHTGELEQLRAWRADWSPEAPVVPTDEIVGYLREMMDEMPGMDPSVLPPIERGRDQRAMLEEVCAAGGPFDLAFIDVMIRHHEGEIALAELVPRHSARQELVDFAQDVIDVQSREIQLLSAWSQAWYGATPAAG